MNKLLLPFLMTIAAVWQTSTAAAATLSIGVADASVGLYHHHIYTTSFRVTRGGWDGPVNITYSGFPAGVTFGPAEPTTSSLPAGQSDGRFCFDVAGATPPGSYPLTITASGNSLTSTATLTLVVKPPVYKGQVNLSYQTKRDACAWQINANYKVDLDYSQSPAKLRIYGSRTNTASDSSSCSSDTRSVDVTVNVTNQYPNINQRVVLLTSSIATETATLEGNALGAEFPIHFGVGYATENGGGGTLVPDLMIAERQELPELYRRTSPPGTGFITTSPSSAKGYAANSVVTLTAYPIAGKVFTGWSGDVTGSTNPVQITMSKDKFVTANFADSSALPVEGKLVNVSTRLPVGVGDNALIAGFIITGNQPKKVLIRGIGPSLPLAAALRDPTLDLDGGARTNNDWRSSQEQEIIATTAAPTNNLEAAIVATLSPGAHTAVLRGLNGGTGIGVVEVYDLTSGGAEKMANISTRGFVNTGDNTMIGGFIISGGATKVIIRAVGPSLNGMLPGALQDTVVELRDSTGSLVNLNDDWRTTQEQQIIDTTVPPGNDRESAIVAVLSPGNYTAVVRGKNNATGVALVEVYSLK